MVENARPIFRSNTNRFIAFAGWGLLGLGFVASFLTGSPRGLLGLVPIAVIALGIWELFWRPEVRVENADVVLVNVFHTIRIPWAKIIDIDTKWAMTIITPDRRYRAAAAPAPGAASRPDMTGARHSARASAGSINKADAPGTDSGNAAALVRGRLKAMADDGTLPIGQAAETHVTVRVHWVSIAVILALTAASAPALLLSA